MKSSVWQSLAPVESEMMGRPCAKFSNVISAETNTSEIFTPSIAPDSIGASVGLDVGHWPSNLYS